jgi:hypothetical protein
LAPNADADPAEVAEIDFALAQALLPMPAMRARARTLVDEAHAIMRREQPKMRAEHRALDRFLLAQGWPAAD